LIAIVSDLHSNLEATRAVVSDIESQGADEIICLGDVIGYGPNPRECLDIAMDFKVTLLGNHENALMVNMEAYNFNEIARDSINWTRDQLNMRVTEQKDENGRRWDFIGELDEVYEDGEITYVHGTPRYPTMEYLYNNDVRFPGKMKAIFSMVNRICFTGHTHIPGIWTEDLVFISVREANYNYRFTNKKTIINVGSVGQPRDADPRASYVLMDNDIVTFRRVEYPFNETVSKIKSTPELNPVLANRLPVAR